MPTRKSEPAAQKKKRSASTTKKVKKAKLATKTPTTTRMTLRSATAEKKNELMPAKKEPAATRKRTRSASPAKELEITPPAKKARSEKKTTATKKVVLTLKKKEIAPAKEAVAARKARLTKKTVPKKAPEKTRKKSVQRVASIAPNAVVLPTEPAKGFFQRMASTKTGTVVTAIEKTIDIVDMSVKPSRKTEVMLDFIEHADVPETSFVGDWINTYAGEIYFLQNYKDACVPIRSYKDDVYEFLEWKCNFQKDVCMRELVVPEDFTTGFRSCQAKKNVRFVFGNILLTYRTSTEATMTAHANAFLIDLKDVDAETGEKIITVEIFEPHGSIYSTDKWYDADQYMKALRNLFIKKLGATRVFEPGEFCPRKSFQSAQANEINEALQSDPAGFCQAWSLWWIEFRLKNAASTKTRQELAKMAIEQLERQKDKKTLTTFIRNYGEFIVRERNKILEDAYEEIGRATEGKNAIEYYETAIKQQNVLEKQIKEMKEDLKLFKALSQNSLKQKNKQLSDHYKKKEAETEANLKSTVLALNSIVDPKISDFFQKSIALQLDRVVRKLHGFFLSNKTI